jgi:hypothetical protein
MVEFIDEEWISLSVTERILWNHRNKADCAKRNKYCKSQYLMVVELCKDKKILEELKFDGCSITKLKSAEDGEVHVYKLRS